MDKGTKYCIFFPTKTRASPLALLKQFVILTGRKICYLRIDGAKEFQSEKIKEFCAGNDVVLQLVVAYNHTMQARVEGAVGCIKKHSRMPWLHTTSPPVSGMTDSTTVHYMDLPYAVSLWVLGRIIASLAEPCSTVWVVDSSCK